MINEEDGLGHPLFFIWNKRSKMTKHNYTEELSVMLADGIINMDDLKSSDVITAMNKAKERFVLSNHQRAITKISKGKKEGKYKTYIGETRKAVEKSSYEDMIDFLYVYYMELQKVHATFEEALQWLIDYKLVNKGRAQSTINRNKATFLRFTTEELLNKEVAEISEDELYKSIRDRIASVASVSHRKPAISDVRAYLQVVNGIFNIALRRGIITRNPAMFISADDFKESCSSPCKDPDKKTMSPDQVSALHKEAKLLAPNPRAYAIRISAYSGLRAGELPCIRWSDIRNGFLHVHSSQRLTESDDWKRIGFEELSWTKNEKGISQGGRYIPITNELKSVLEEISAHQKSINLQTDYILCDDDGSPITKTSYEKYLARICKRLGFKVTNNHALRMSYSSNYLLPMGLDARERALITGHSVEVEERFYSHAGTYLYEPIKQKMVQTN